MNANILSCRPGSYQKFADGAYEHLAGIGVKCVEIPAPADPKAELARLASLGLVVASLHGQCDLAADDAVERFAPQVGVARDLGARLIYLSVNVPEDQKPAGYERLRRMGDAAAAQGVTIVIETHPNLVNNGAVGKETMERVNHPNVRINWDTANVYYYNENVDGIEEMKKLIGYIGAVHLKDTNGRPKTWHFPALGEGIVDFKEVFRLLNERGFHGPFTMEIEGVEGESLDRAATEDRVARSVAHLRRLGCVA
jgi:sugar phosphate isomerase/epimerase